MKRFISHLAINIALSSFAFGQSPTAQQSANSTSEQEVRQMIEKYRTAILQRDIATLEKIWADDYVFVNAAGDVLAKTERLANSSLWSFAHVRCPTHLRRARPPSGSSRAASSLSVVKLSRAEAKSSVVEGFSSRFWVASLGDGSACADWVGWGEPLFKVEPSGDSTGRSATEIEDAESRLWALLSSGKFGGLSRVFHARGCGDGCGAISGRLALV